MIITAIMVFVGILCGLCIIEGNARHLDNLWGYSFKHWLVSTVMFALYNIGIIFLLKAL